MLLVRRSKLYYTASGIITLCRWPSRTRDGHLQRAVFPLLSVCNFLSARAVRPWCFPSFSVTYSCTSDVTPCSLVGSHRCFGASYCTTVIPLSTFVRKFCVVYHDTWRHIMEDSNVKLYPPENLEFYLS